MPDDDFMLWIRELLDRAGYAGGELLELDVREEKGLDYPDDHFDLVVAAGVLERLRYDRWMLQEAQRVLKPGGLLAVAVPNPCSLSKLVDPRQWIPYAARILRRRLAPSAHGSPARMARPGRIAPRLRYRPARLRALLHGLGYEIVGERHRGFGLVSGLDGLEGPSPRLDRILQARADRAQGSRLSRLAEESVFLCRKRRPVQRVEEHWLLQDERALRAEFARQRRAHAARLNRWLRRNERYRRMQPALIADRIAMKGPVLVLSPHPDDELVGCGGTLIAMRDAGTAVTVLQLTDGSATAALRGVDEIERRTGRLREAERVAQRLGADLVTWAEPDRGLRRAAGGRDRLAALLAEVKPRAIFTPPLHDPHPDHAAAAALLAEALPASGLDLEDSRVACYEVWTLVPVNALSVIDAQVERKERLLMEYRYGMMVVDYIASSRLAAAAHALRYLGRPGFAEAFFVLSARDFAALGREGASGRRISG